MESTYRQNSQRLIVVMLILNLMMITAPIFFLRESLVDYRRQIETAAEDQSLFLEHEIADTFKLVDTLLASIADEFEFLARTQPQFTKILKVRTTRLKRLSNVVVTNAEGLTVFSKTESAALTSTPLFKETVQLLHHDTGDRMLISQPHEEQTSGARHLLLARRIDHPDGSFAGAVVATVPMKYFQDMFSKFNLGTNSSIELHDSKLQLIVRHPPYVESKPIGSQKLPDDFRMAIERNPNSGAYDADISSADGTKRLHSFRHNTAYGFYINVGIAKDTYLSEFQRHIIQSSVMVAAFILLSLALVKLLQKSWKKQLNEEAKRATAEAEFRKLSRVAEQSPVAIVITDLAGNIEFVNPKFIEITGYRADEVIGRKPSLLQSGETESVVYDHLWQTILSGNVWEGDFCNKKKSGELFWEHSTISPLRNAEGQITHFIAIKEDITQKLSVMNQLVQSQKMQSIGQLAGGIAHDFSNILSIINGYTCLMQLETNNDDPIREYLDFIQEATSRAGGLTHALLAFSRKQIIKPRVQNLNIVLSNVSALLERTMRDDIIFRMFFEDNPLYVYIDSVQIDHVLINIATNAMDAMPDGGKFSIISSRCTMDADFIHSKQFGEPGEYAAVEISDSGIGMDNETVRRIFEPFFTTKDEGKGTGLGLAMAFGIIKQHNGFIDVSSQPGRGTTFTLFLPLLPQNEVDIDDTIPLGLESLPKGDETLLLAEDEPNVRKLIKRLLESCGYTVIVAGDGQEAVDIFQTCGKKIDLLFFDLIMPRKNGREAYLEIRNICKNVKVLFNSGYPADELHKMKQPDMDIEFLSKPVHPMTLMTKIRELLDR